MSSKAVAKKQDAVVVKKQDPLPSKLHALYRDILKLYDDKLYKKATRVADKILESKPDHGETQALKGMCVFNLGRKQEGLDLLRIAAKNDIKSPTVWQVYGSLYRSDRNAGKAIECYKNSLKLDPTNQAVLKELGAAYLQSRDFRAHHDIRRQQLTAAPKLAANWTGLAVAHQLAGNCELALAVVEHYELMQLESLGPRGSSLTIATATNASERTAAVEASELILYKVRILQQMGMTARALKILGDGCTSNRITDRLLGSQQRAELWLKLNRPQSALELYVELLRINPEHGGYHHGLQSCVLGIPLNSVMLDAGAGGGLLRLIPAASGATGGANGTAASHSHQQLTGAQVDLLLGIYAALAAQHPRSRACRRIPLDFLPASHPAFKPLLSAYVRGGLRKGIPSLFADVKTLFRTASERALGWTARCASRLVCAAPPTEKAAIMQGLLDEMLPAFSAADTASAAAAASAGGAEHPIVFVAHEIADVDALVQRVAAAASATTLKPVPGAAPPPPPPPSDAAADAAAPLVVEAMTPVGGVGAAAFRSLCRASGDVAATAPSPPSDAAAPPSEPPSVFPWVALLAARLADEGGDTPLALRILSAAEAHSPTVIDLYVAKARVLKHAGDSVGAAATMDAARLLDLADRYLNSKATKYLLRAGDVRAACATIALFVRHESKEPDANPLGNLREMQVMWFELEAAEAAERNGDLGLALKHFSRVEEHFADWVFDENEFHAYCLRRMALRAYVDFLAMVDTLRGHAYFLRASAGSARCYASLAAVRAAGAPAAAAAATAAAAAAEKGGKHKAAAAAAATAAAASTALVVADDSGANSSSGGDDAKPGVEKDDDPTGSKKLSACVSPLDDAAKAVKALTENLPLACRAAAHARSASSSASGGGGGQATPTVGSPIRSPSMFASLPSRGWNVSPDAVVRAHTLAVDIALARDKPLLAVSHFRAAVGAAPASEEVRRVLAAASVNAAAAVPPPSALHPAYLHPVIWLSATRLAAAADAVIVMAAPGDAAVAAALSAFLSLPVSAGGFPADRGAAASALSSIGLSHATAVARGRLEAECGGAAGAFPAMPGGVHSAAVSAAAVAAAAALKSADNGVVRDVTPILSLLQRAISPSPSSPLLLRPCLTDALSALDLITSARAFNLVSDAFVSEAREGLTALFPRSSALLGKQYPRSSDGVEEALGEAMREATLQADA